MSRVTTALPIVECFVSNHNTAKRKHENCIFLPIFSIFTAIFCEIGENLLVTQWNAHDDALAECQCDVMWALNYRSSECAKCRELVVITLTCPVPTIHYRVTTLGFHIRIRTHQWRMVCHWPAAMRHQRQLRMQASLPPHPVGHPGIRFLMRTHTRTRIHILCQPYQEQGIV